MLDQEDRLTWLDLSGPNFTTSRLTIFWVTMPDWSLMFSSERVTQSLPEKVSCWKRGRSRRPENHPILYCWQVAKRNDFVSRFYEFEPEIVCRIVMTLKTGHGKPFNKRGWGIPSCSEVRKSCTRILRKLLLGKDIYMRTVGPAAGKLHHAAPKGKYTYVNYEFS